MPCVHRSQSLMATAIAVVLTTLWAAPSAFAAADSVRRPVIIDSHGGINNGQSGFVVQTGPLSWQPIVEAQPIAAPTQLAPEPPPPIMVAPYIQLPVGGGSPARPQPRPVPVPH